MDQTKKSDINIGILTFPISKAGSISTSNLVDIVYPLSNDLYLITGNNGYDFFKEDKRIHTSGIRHKRGANVVTRILRYIYTQLRISYTLAKITRNVDIWIFFIGGTSLLFPMLTAKLFKKDVILAFAGSPILTLISANDNLVKPVEILSKINCTLSDKIILYSPKLIKEWNLEKYKNKISIAHEHFVDFNEFEIKKQLKGRETLVGYIGRLSEEKGVLNFVKAIPKMLGEKGIKFLVGGDGQLRDEIERYLEGENLNDKVKLTGWIPDEEFSTYLNELKLFVLPSYTEGLPHTLLEAMASGTPVLATPVGAIPDVIKDGETGFIMENNSPECIAKNIVRALAHPNINEITKNARALIEEKYNYQAAVDRYRIILSSTF